LLPHYNNGNYWGYKHDMRMEKAETQAGLRFFILVGEASPPYGVTVNFPALVAVPAAVVSVITPVVAPAGTVA